MGELVRPARIVPVSKPLPVAVWETESALRQATVCPALTVAGLGENDWLPSIPLIVIVTSAAVGPPLDGGVGIGDGLGLYPPPPHATATANPPTTARIPTVLLRPSSDT